jgi:hypothetical protein
MAVPFTNNQAEQNIRMAKVQMKIFGSRRALTGASRRLTVRAYLTTPCKTCDRSTTASKNPAGARSAMR